MGIPRRVSRHPWILAAVVGICFGLAWSVFIFHGSWSERLGLGAIIAALWGALQGGSRSLRNLHSDDEM
jgi:hypothetical protein